MISPNSAATPLLPPSLSYFQQNKSPNSSPESNSQANNAERGSIMAAQINKMTNFSIAAIMNSAAQRNSAMRKFDNSDDSEELEIKRRKLAEAVPALGKKN
jgi:hypothetical protein